MGLCGIIETEEIKNDERIYSLLPVLWKEIGKKEIQWEIRRFWGVQTKKVLQPRLYEQSIYKNWEKQPKISPSSPISKNSRHENTELSQYVFNLWESWKSRYTPYRWKLPEQQFRQFNSFMSELSQQDSQKKECLQDLWKTCERTRLLQQTLFKIQEIWESIYMPKQSYLRIRKLTPLETCRLMGADDLVCERLKSAGLSDAQIYHIMGDGLIVQIPQKIIEEMIRKD